MSLPLPSAERGRAGGKRALPAPISRLDSIASRICNRVGKRFIHHAPERVQGPDYDWGPGGSELVGEYVRSIRDKEGVHWLELRLVEQGPWTGARLGSVYSLRAERVRMLEEVR